MADIFEIAGRIHSTSQEEVVTVADEILDSNKNKKQSNINAEVDATLAEHTSTIQGLNSQNYETYTATDQTTAETDVLPADGSEDTIYRLGNWDGSQYDVTCYSEYSWNGSAYVHISTKIQIGEVFDISAYHATGGTLATYADLSAALDSNNGGGVPQSLQKGGMSVKFVCSSDNKYVQYRLMKNTWSINTSDWALYSEDVLVENPEFINVKTDKEGRILWAIKNDGSIHWGAGVPQQVIDYVSEKIEELSLDEYEDIVAFLGNLITGDKTLQELLNEKVDKVEGKSLIDADYASSQSAIDNPEYLKVTTDSEDKILEGIKQDGTKVIDADLEVGGSASVSGDIKVLGNMEVSGVSYKVIESPEYLAAWVDTEDKVIFGLKADGKTYIGDADFINEIKKNQESISEIKPIINKIFNGNKKISILGDSISTFNQEGFKIDGYAMWYPNKGDRSSDVTSVTDTWWMQVINSIGGVLEVNASASGSTASNRIIGFSPRVSLLGKPDIIYIALGTNDSTGAVPIGEINFNAQSYDLSQFAPAYIKGMQDTIAAYPKAKIICVAFDMEINYQNAIKIIAEHYGAEYIYVGDITDVHPNKTEMAAAANKISPAPQIYFENNPVYIEVKTDSEGKLLAGRTPDGAAFENVGFSAPKVSIDGATIENIEDPEGRSEITTDAEGKIISHRDADGVKHEEVGIETKNIKAENIEADNLQLKGEAIDVINEIASNVTDQKLVNSLLKKYNLPKFGYIDIVSETFYLTSDERYSDLNGVYLIQDYPNTEENARQKITISNFYIKSTLTDNGDGTYSKNENSVKLDFYAGAQVTKISGVYYVTDSLTEIVDPVTGDISYEINQDSIAVTQLTDVPPINAWSVDKSTKHTCVVSVDFGRFLSDTYYAMVSYQGSSTLTYLKRNFRVTFYKNSSFAKKNKVKIGEFVRTSGFNLKANWTDSSRIKEYIMNLIFMAIWEKRDVYDQYPWNKANTPYTGATGMIKGFPVQCSVGGEFYGFDIFGLKKDKANYILDKDKDGMIEGGTSNSSNCWTAAEPIQWEDELNDEEDWVIDNQTQSNYDALTEFFAFINERLYIGSDNNNYKVTELTDISGTMYVTSSLVDGQVTQDSISATLIPFNKSTMKERMGVLDWIDYLICIQVFLMRDNTCRNLMLYTASDKKKFYPFFYDLDLSWQFNKTDTYNIDIMDCNPGPGSYAGDMSLWNHIKDAYWDEICNRYNELRVTILNTDYIKAVFDSVVEGLPQDIYTKEYQRWWREVSKDNFLVLLDAMEKRLNYLDFEYYIN